MYSCVATAFDGVENSQNENNQKEPPSKRTCRRNSNESIGVMHADCEPDSFGAMTAVNTRSKYSSLEQNFVS